MINFYLPGFSDGFRNTVNLFFIDLLNSNPEYFYDNIVIKGVYDCFRGMIWNGGRGIMGNLSLTDAINILESYNSRNVSLRFTYTNSKLTEDLYFDKQCNIITMLAHNGKNEIIINDDKFYNFLKSTYPNYNYISSTTKCLLDEDNIKNELNKYYLTVLDYRKNKNFKLLNELNPERIELLLNPYCGVGCQSRAEHYAVISESQLENSMTKEAEWMEQGNCKCYCPNFYENLKNNSAVIKKEELQNYINMGFKHFKIEGRTNNIIDVIESYLYYMVKPEYIDEIRYKVLKML